MTPKSKPTPDQHAEELKHEEIKRFIHAVGHELKQPLGLIRAYTYYIKKNISSDEKNISQYPEKIDQQVDIITAMLNNIVDNTKASVSLIVLNKEKTNFDELLDEIILQTKTLFPQRKVVFTNQTSITTISVDKIRITQALINIIINAIKYSSENNSISIEITNDTSKLLIAITDTGIGVPTDELTTIFDSYYRASNAKEYGVKGLGLGLTIARKIIELHDGTITVDSTLDQGSTFAITLPLI